MFWLTFSPSVCGCCSSAAKSLAQMQIRPGAAMPGNCAVRYNIFGQALVRFGLCTQPGLSAAADATVNNKNSADNLYIRSP